MQTKLKPCLLRLVWCGGAGDVWVTIKWKVHTVKWLFSQRGPRWPSDRRLQEPLNDSPEAKTSCHSPGAKKITTMGTQLCRLQHIWHLSGWTRPIAAITWEPQLGEVHFHKFCKVALLWGRERWMKTENKFYNLKAPNLLGGKHKLFYLLKYVLPLSVFQSLTTVSSESCVKSCCELILWRSTTKSNCKTLLKIKLGSPWSLWVTWLQWNKLNRNNNQVSVCFVSVDGGRESQL